MSGTFFCGKDQGRARQSQAERGYSLSEFAAQVTAWAPGNRTPGFWQENDWQENAEADPKCLVFDIPASHIPAMSLRLAFLALLRGFGSSFLASKHLHVRLQ